MSDQTVNTSSEVNENTKGSGVVSAVSQTALNACYACGARAFEHYECVAGFDTSFRHPESMGEFNAELGASSNHVAAAHAAHQASSSFEENGSLVSNSNQTSNTTKVEISESEITEQIAQDLKQQHAPGHGHTYVKHDSFEEQLKDVAQVLKEKAEVLESAASDLMADNIKQALQQHAIDELSAEAQSIVKSAEHKLASYELDKAESLTYLNDTNLDAQADAFVAKVKAERVAQGNAQAQDYAAMAQEVIGGKDSDLVSEAASKAAATASAAVAAVESEVAGMVKSVEENRATWALIAIMGMLTAFGPICTDIYLPAIPEITKQFAASASAVQLSITATFFGLALGQIVVGPLSDRYGRKKPLLICLVVFSLASLACAYSSNVPELVVARVLQGLSGAGGVVLTRSMACDMFSGHKLTEFMSMLMAVNSVAPILGPILGSAIVSYFAWPALFFFLVLWGAVLFVGSSTLIKETLPVEKRHANALNPIKAMFSQLFNARFMCLCLSLSCIMGAFVGYLAASPFIFQSIYHLSEIGYAMVFGSAALCMSISAQISARIAKRMNAVKQLNCIFTLYLCSGLGFWAVIILEPQSFVWAQICSCLLASMMAMAQAAGFAFVMGSRTCGAGAASGIFGVFSYMSGSLLSPFAGIMGELSMVPLATMIVCCGLAAFVLMNVGARLRNQSPDIEIKIVKQRQEYKNET